MSGATNEQGSCTSPAAPGDTGRSPYDARAHHLAAGQRGPIFTNPWGNWTLKAFSDAWAWQRQRSKDNVPRDGWLVGNRKATPTDYAKAFPLHRPAWEALREGPPPGHMHALWVGHASMLVQMEGLTFITDPLFSERCAPVQFIGPKRLVAPAISGSEPELPNLDFVLLSHNHYDHLDTGSVRTLHRRFGTALTWYVPLGLKPWFKSEGITSNVIEMDWWESRQHADTKVTITMVPAQHWSARGLTDRCRTLWGGYVVKGPQTGSFYFVGDTGYHEEPFRQIRQRLGLVDLAAIPVGAYEPRWFMKDQHVNPEEALQIHKDVGATTSLAIHTATFYLTDEALDEPPARLVQAVQAAGLPQQSFITLQHGQMAVFKKGQGLVNSPKTLPVEGSPALQVPPPAADGAAAAASAAAAGGQ